MGLGGSLDIRHESGDHLQIHVRSLTCDVTFSSVITSGWPGPSLDSGTRCVCVIICYWKIKRAIARDCVDRLTVNHALSCKKGNFVAQIHEGIRNLLASLLSKVCNNVEEEPRLLPISNRVFDQRSTVTSPEDRLNIKAGGFWTRGFTAFLDIHVTHVNSTCNQKRTRKRKERTKKELLAYKWGLLPPPPGFGTNVGKECKFLLTNLQDKLFNKNGEFCF